MLTKCKNTLKKQWSICERLAEQHRLEDAWRRMIWAEAAVQVKKECKVLDIT